MTSPDTDLLITTTLPLEISPLPPYWISRILFLLLLVAFPFLAIWAWRSRSRPLHLLTTPSLILLFSCVTLLFDVALETIDKLFWVFELGMAIGVQDVDFSNWLFQYRFSQEPILYALGLSFLYCNMFFVCLFRSNRTR